MFKAMGMSVVLTAWNMGVIVGPAVGGMSNVTQFNAVIYLHSEMYNV